MKKRGEMAKLAEMPEVCPISGVDAEACSNATGCKTRLGTLRCQEQRERLTRERRRS